MAQDAAANSSWTPSSWRRHPLSQKVDYPSQEALDSAVRKLTKLPPLVTPKEIHKLKNSLRAVAQGKAFLLQGGDCAELFDYCNAETIEAKIKLLLQMSLVLVWGADKPIVRIARIAGQFAKPRSSPTETLPDGSVIPSFRGDNVNGFSPTDRTPDPERLVHAYFHSAATMNYIRAALDSGIADLHNPLDWGLGHVQDTALKAKYREIVRSITDSLRFMKTVGGDTSNPALETVDLYTSHEGLMLDYEEALTRKLRRPPEAFTSVKASRKRRRSSVMLTPEQLNGYYATSAHFLWIGARTVSLPSAHAEYFRGLSNPLGLKISPSLPPSALGPLLNLLNPTKEVGKLTLITRYGADKIADCLPAHIDAVKEAGYDRVVVWCCDPMHGNTISVPAPSPSQPKIKTRKFESILSEVTQAFNIHRSKGTFLGGVHLELTGEAVTECVGGSEGLGERDLEKRYESHCDPRLNERQSLELAFLVAREMRMENSDTGSDDDGDEMTE